MKIVLNLFILNGDAKPFQHEIIMLDDIIKNLKHDTKLSFNMKGHNGLVFNWYKGNTIHMAITF